jgi:hypothetical protein
MQGLQRLSSTTEIHQFVQLWTRVRAVQLSNQPDDIRWRLGKSGQYSSRSAYTAHFHCSFADHDWQRLWKIKADNKCKFFGWLILQNRLWMADRVAKHGGQSSRICQLFHTHPKTALHMIVQCPYAKSVWQGLQSWLGTALQQPSSIRYRLCHR